MKQYTEYQQIVEQSLLPQLESLGAIPSRLRDAMAYSLTAGGKRLRPVLLLAACDLYQGSMQRALPFACALEMIHTYSLIHDDLPAMDDDDFRRNKPTNHKVFGEGIAILAGDALLNGAMELMLSASLTIPDSLGVRATASIARRAGVCGMIAGQALDLLNEGTTPSAEIVHTIHLHKTADLITAPVEAGLILAGAEESAIAAGVRYGQHLGLAFQMVDDLLDVVGDPAKLGKNIGMDEKAHKQTWVSVHGIEATREDARHQAESAIDAIRQVPRDVSFFTDLALDLLHRVN